jgi:hypothetical protein
MSHNPIYTPINHPLEKTLNEKNANNPEHVHPLYRALVAELNTLVQAHGEAVLNEPTNSLKFAHMLDYAPESYFSALEMQTPGAAKEFREWATDHIERHDYAEFFDLLNQVGDIRRADGRDALHTPKHAGLFVRLMQMAPPRYRAVVDEIAEESGLVPKPTHVNADGEPVFDLQQLADHLGTPVEDLRDFADQHIAADAMYRGIVYPIQ